MLFPGRLMLPENLPAHTDFFPIPWSAFRNVCRIRWLGYHECFVILLLQAIIQDGWHENGNQSTWWQLLADRDQYSGCREQPLSLQTRHAIERSGTSSRGGTGHSAS
jgi:hypothetical protein